MLVLRGVIALGACGLLLLSALVLGAGSGEYPLLGRPGMRFVLIEAAPPLLGGLAGLFGWVMPGALARRGVRLVAMVVVTALLARAVARMGGGAPPAAWMELGFLIVVALGIVMLELLHRLAGEEDAARA